MSEKNYRADIATTTAKRLRSVWFVIFMAVVPTALQFAIRAADQITLWQVYGHERVAREHLRITRSKPRLVVSNGDVLWDKGFTHYLISAAIWLPLSVGVLMLIFYTLVPKAHREAWQSEDQSISGFGILWGVGLLILSMRLVPFPVSFAISAASVVVVLIWAHRTSTSAN